jgi:hypothetical protein
MVADERGFSYLNLASRWPQFDQRYRLTIHGDGSLTLGCVPGVAEILGKLQEVSALSVEPAGVSSDAKGDIYLSDPTTQRVFKLDTCSGISEALPCFGGKGNGPGQLNKPRGLLVGPRHALYVADSDNHRVQIVDLRTGQLRGVWGQTALSDPPIPSNAVGRFNQPWDLTADNTGAIYVVERAGRRWQKFDPDGQVVPSFWENLRGAVSEPTYVAATVQDDAALLFLVDVGLHQVLVVDPSGALQSSWSLPAKLKPVGIVVADTAVLIGDQASGQLFQFDLQGDLVGATPDYRGPIAALALYHEGSILLYPGGGTGVVRLAQGAGFAKEGMFLAGPFDSGTALMAWRRLQALASPLLANTYLQLFTYTSDTKDVLVMDPSTPFPSADGWRSCPSNVLDVLILNPPARYLWIGGILQGDGRASPRLVQMKLSRPPGTYLNYLPAIYRKDEQTHLHLERFLALFESVLGSLEEQTGDLPLLFDPFSAPTGWAHWLLGWQRASDEKHPSDWLPWLARWLAFQLDETWPEGKTRQAIADAFGLYGQRGTVLGLRRLIKLYAGADAFIEEPGHYTSLWSLGEVSRLGWDTMLAPANAQGAVLDISATLDRSHLIEGKADAAPLWEDSAYRFCIWVYQADLERTCTRTRIKEVLDREKPAHTEYELCIIEPHFRVGFQARIGIDAVVAGPGVGLTLNKEQPLGRETVLMPDDQEIGGRIGQRARMGQDTTLT